MAHINNFTYGALNPVLAYLVSCLGCFLGLRCTTRARAALGRARASWLLLATLSIATTGIWVMHFVAMLGFTIQGQTIDMFRANHPHPEKARVSQGLVVIPTDNATDGQIRRYREYAASRFERTKAPQGPRGMLFSPDYVGSSDELADQLYDHAGFQRADELAFALPFTFDEDDYRQIITDLAESLGPRFGWEPADSSAADRR